MRTETLPPADPEHTELRTYRSSDDCVFSSNYSPTHLVEAIPHHSSSVILLASLITTTQRTTYHYACTSESNADPPMTVIEDIHTTHENPDCIDTSTTSTNCPPFLTPEHTAGPVEVYADV
ncbi:hypothetical protein [Haladaptatus sp. CMAA 1911]|uniref:hypothetical protein n=1 Tax=unclassified Haladaptatus TaxID=2622732 RepID=UPI0037545812